MKNFAAVFACLCLISAASLVAERPSDAARFWPQWRGPDATGVAPYADPPLEWSETKNIRWKVEIPGKGSATPIVWDDKVFILTAIPTGEPVEPKSSDLPQRRGRRRRGMGIPRNMPTQVQQFSMFAINRHDGKVLWKRIVREELPHESKHTNGTWASGSPVTDGEIVFAYFGSWGLYCFDMEGKLLWEKDLGDMTIRLGFGEGSSPALHDDKIIISWDHQGQSFIVALDKRTGREIWRVNRDEMTSWATPIVVGHNGKKQIITSATNRVRSYDLENGELIWESGGMTLNTIPSPVAAEGMVFVTSGFRGNALLAIRLADARGDISDSNAIVWRHDQDTPYTPSPLLYGDTLYFLKRNSGVLSSFKAGTGQENYSRKRLKDVPNVFASPVGASNRVYITGRDGNMVVLEHGPEFKILAVNSLEDGFDASPALVDKDIYLRGRQYLYCISED